MTSSRWRPRCSYTPGRCTPVHFGMHAPYSADRDRSAAFAQSPANFLRTLVLPGKVERWSLTGEREKVAKIGAKVVSHGRYAIFQMAEVAVPRELFGHT